MRNRWAASAATLLLLGTACEPAEGLTPTERGRRVYAANCTACHHPDPARRGTLGPALAGADRALIHSMVTRGEPPGGYPADHSGARMPALRHLEQDVDAIAAYLEALEAGS